MIWALLSRAFWHGDRRYLTTIGVLLVVCVASLQRVAHLSAALAAKPKIEVRTQTKTVIKRIAGPVSVREKIVYLPGGERIVERVIERAPVETERATDAETERVTTPVEPPRLRPQWYAGAGWAPKYDRGRAWSLRVGLAWRHFDLGYRYGRVDDSHGVETALRF